MSNACNECLHADSNEADGPCRNCRVMCEYCDDHFDPTPKPERKYRQYKPLSPPGPLLIKGLLPTPMTMVMMGDDEGRRW